MLLLLLLLLKTVNMVQFIHNKGKLYINYQLYAQIIIYSYNITFLYMF